MPAIVQCQTCQYKNKQEAVWACQPFGPDEGLVFTTLGNHYRGFPIIKVCDLCKRIMQRGYPAKYFTYKGIRYAITFGKVNAVAQLLQGVEVVSDAKCQS